MKWDRREPHVSHAITTMGIVNLLLSYDFWRSRWVISQDQHNRQTCEKRDTLFLRPVTSQSVDWFIVFVVLNSNVECYPSWWNRLVNILYIFWTVRRRTKKHCFGGTYLEMWNGKKKCRQKQMSTSTLLYRTSGQKRNQCYSHPLGQAAGWPEGVEASPREGVGPFVMLWRRVNPVAFIVFGKSRPVLPVITLLLFRCPVLYHNSSIKQRKYMHDIIHSSAQSTWQLAAFSTLYSYVQYEHARKMMRLF